MLSFLRHFLIIYFFLQGSYFSQATMPSDSNELTLEVKFRPPSLSTLQIDFFSDPSQPDWHLNQEGTFDTKFSISDYDDLVMSLLEVRVFNNNKHGYELYVDSTNEFILKHFRGINDSGNDIFSFEGGVHEINYQLKFFKALSVCCFPNNGIVLEETLTEDGIILDVLNPEQVTYSGLLNISVFISNDELRDAFNTANDQESYRDSIVFQLVEK